MYGVLIQHPTTTLVLTQRLDRLFASTHNPIERKKRRIYSRHWFHASTVQELLKPPPSCSTQEENVMIAFLVLLDSQVRV